MGEDRPPRRSGPRPRNRQHSEPVQQQQQALTVHLHHLDDAKCVAEAMRLDDSSVTQSEDGWIVSVLTSTLKLADVLSALRDCLVEQQIPLVRVTIDGKTYAMEAAPGPSRAS